MPTPFKKALSFLYPIIIERFDSKVSGIIELSLQNGKVVVDTKDANYSFGSLHRIYREVLTKIDFKKEGQEVLILGFGAGSIATILTQELKLNLNIDGVDLDPVMLEIYYKHFYLEKNNLKLYEKEAIIFLQESEKKYDYIFIDLFQNLEVPQSIVSQNFIDLLKKVSKQHAQITMNTMLQDNDWFVSLWMKEFDQAKRMRVEGANLVLLAIL